MITRNSQRVFLVAGILIIPAIMLAGIFYSANAQRLAITCPDISTLPCTSVKLSPSITLEFDGADGGLLDKNGLGMGFTMVDPPRKPGNITPTVDAPGYWPEKLEVISGTLVISTTPGLMSGVSDSQDNALGFGLDMGGPIVLETTITNVVPGPGGFAQAGLWFGKSDIGPSGLGGTGSAESNYIKLVLVSPDPGEWRVQSAIEIDDIATASPRDTINPNEPLTLRLEINPSIGSVVARYCNTTGCDASQEDVFQTYNNVPSEWFSTDAAGIDLNVGTRSMGGIFASHRNAITAIEFEFEDFIYASNEFTIPMASKDGIDFSTWVFEPVDKPTAMDWGPDDRLYVSDVTGLIHIFTIDQDNQVILSEEVITSTQNRLMLGLTIDPESTLGNVILWVSHSDLSQSTGEANSGTISRLTGPGFSIREDIITGLPRAIANHATNNIHFGPDGRLYISQGGNTGAGSSNDGASEFGPRPEQPLSAAILVADVKQPGFDGTCTSVDDPDGSIMDSTGISATDIPCDVVVYASGLRNSYDHVWHSNNQLYASDNGLGVIGTFPDLAPSDLYWNPLTGCEGMITGTSGIQAHFPGEWPDMLFRIIEGGFYGHPNPSRGECIFYGGNPTASPDYFLPVSSAVSGTITMDIDQYEVGLLPATDWKQAILGLGENKSANSIIEYASNGNAFCGRMDGDLLLTYFSQEDQIRRIILSEDGQTVLTDTALIRSAAFAGGIKLSNPLPITQDPQGRLYVGEFGFNQIKVFVPKNVGLWTTTGVANLPVEILDAGSSVLNGKLYVVAGKNGLGHQRSLYAYSAIANMWETLSDLPVEYPAVENPAVVSHNGKLYVFGGSTAPFTGAVAKTAVYDPILDQWTMLTDMPTARGGLMAAVVNESIYVMGGLDINGDSVATVEIYDINTNSWSAGISMPAPRDNAGSAFLNGRIYLFGGRIRSGGSDIEPTLTTVESFAPGDLSWTGAAPMPTGRRSSSVAIYNGRAIVFGGEKDGAGNTFTAVKSYNPTTDQWELLTDMPFGRHGAAAGLLGNAILIVGGGPLGGASYTSDVDIFHFDCAVTMADVLHIYLPLLTR